ncbi:MAG: hypothetical protein H6825_03385 [Planctomycetes bacterium]|nr:hypothetical protein [Planctomycetota bacterium]
MITKDQLAAAMLRECDICLHLHGKLDAAAFDYRPSDGQRSTLELLRYLAVCGIAPVRCMLSGDWSQWAALTAHVKEMPAAGFPAAMARQKNELGAWFAEVTEHELETRVVTLPTGVEVPLGVAVLEGPLKWLTGYKLQLFLYAKASGASDLGTSNAWVGVDRVS